MSDIGADELPMLSLNRAQIELWTRQLTTAAALLREARTRAGRHVWSQAEQAAREHDRLAVTAATVPPVRAMNDGEAAQWVPGEPTVVQGHGQRLEVSLGPCGDGRRGLGARLHVEGSDKPDPTHTVHVSFANHHDAQQVADELIAAGPNPGTLERLATLLAQRGGAHADALTQVRQTQRQRADHLAAAAAQAWGQDLAQAVLDSPAFAVFADRCHQLEERGYTTTDLLARIPATALHGAHVRDPGALASWHARKLLDTLIVIDDSAVDGDATVLAAEPPPRRGTDQVAMAAVVRQGLPAQLAATLLDCPAWPALAGALAEAHRAGMPVEHMLAGLPAEAIGRARKPAAYAAKLMSQRVTARRAAQASRGDTPTSTTTASPAVGVATPTHPEIITSRRLNPASAIDRIGILDTTTLDADSDAVAAHHHAVQHVTPAVGVHDRATGYERGEPSWTHHDQDRTRPGQDQTDPGQDDRVPARVDNNLGAGLVASAARQAGVPAAAALRAKVVLTPPSLPDPNTAPTRPSPSGAHPPGPGRTRAVPSHTRTR